jgi:hypothetical protein
LAIQWYDFSREPDLAIDHLERAARPSPLDPLNFIVQNVVALANFFAGATKRHCPGLKRP